MQVVSKIKSLDLDHDLVIMGHRPTSRLLFSEGMIGSSENPELGVIRDVSERFLSTSTSTLVIQSHQ